MQLVVNDAQANYANGSLSDGTNSSNHDISSVSINFTISELFENVNTASVDCSIKVLNSDFTANPTPEQQETLVKNKIVDELNKDQLQINWSKYHYNRMGTSVDTVDVYFTTYDTDAGNNIVIKNFPLNIPYSQFQTDTANGIDGLIADIKSHLITEFTEG